MRCHPVVQTRRAARRAVRAGAAGLALAALGGVLVGSAGAAAVAPPADQSRCTPPTGAGAQFQAKGGASLGFDDARLQAALRVAAKQAPVGVTAVYRHGCLAGQLTTNSSVWRRYQGWSMSKSITSLAAAHAEMDGELSWDDPLGSLEPRAGAAKGAITLEEFANQTTGFRHNLVTDFSLLGGPYGDFTKGWFFRSDIVRTLLGEPLTHTPGTWWEYQQPPVTLAASMIGAAVGQDIRGYADAALMRPLGIPSDRWGWDHDRTGQSLGFMGVRMAAPYWARFGQMLLDGGTYDGARLVPESYVASLHQGTAANPFYRRYFWNNAADHGYLPSGLGRTVVKHPLAESAPRDMIMMQGAFGQAVVVIPSLDLVIVRLQEYGGDALGQGSVQALVGVLKAIDDGTTAGLTPDIPLRLPMNGIPDENYPLSAMLETIAQTRPGPLPARVPLRPRALNLQAAAATSTGLRITVSCPAARQETPCEGTVSAGGASAPYSAAPGTRGEVLLPSVAVAAGSTATVTATNVRGTHSTPSGAVLTVLPA